MAKDDYFVIAYQILAYLYQSLKKGERPDPEMIGNESIYFQVNGQSINKLYWAYIIYHLQEDGLIEGAVFADIDNLDYPYPMQINKIRITPAGIGYLSENSFIEKAKEFLKDTKSIIPFV